MQVIYVHLTCCLEVEGSVATRQYVHLAAGHCNMRVQHAIDTARALLASIELEICFVFLNNRQGRMPLGELDVVEEMRD
jgi:hypothetical protein